MLKKHITGKSEKNEIKIGISNMYSNYLIKFAIVIMMKTGIIIYIFLHIT